MKQYLILAGLFLLNPSVGKTDPIAHAADSNSVRVVILEYGSTNQVPRQQWSDLELRLFSTNPLGMDKPGAILYEVVRSNHNELVVQRKLASK